VRSFDYTYDDNSNRLSETKESGTTTFTYNDANQLVIKGSTTYDYDGNGSETSNSAEPSMTYDAKNHMTFDHPRGRLRAGHGILRDDDRPPNRWSKGAIDR
jgi:YD repeat-containing protein